MQREKMMIFTAITFTFPWIFSYIYQIHYPPHVTALISGSAVISSAFLISWSAETAEIDIPRSLSLAVVALLAVLPEYAVDVYFAWMAGKVGGAYTHYATANMTGANRLLLGVGWSLVALTAMMKLRKGEVELDEGLRLETFILLLATLYCFTIPLKGNIHPVDGLILISLFFLYIYLATKAYREEFELEGVPKYLASFPEKIRRIIIVTLLFFSAFVIFISVEAFAEALIGTAKSFGLDEFLMVQWVAPLASESPEFVVAMYLVRRMRITAGMNALISSKVNQWTLLIGCLPIVYSMALLTPSPLPLDARQREEILLTASQSLFGLAIISNLRINLWEALALLTLFLAQFVYESIETRYILSIIYIALSIPIIVKERENIRVAMRYITRVINS
ncbi:sodium:calcium antiporter [Archaeoglobus profundus]|uniref:Sodium/calcium exchanger membrane region n=1 Tax=Archaeoglobus profundus (strain DSM 5631 / JCM 9629 / NBRC 100127 / Av18) TaxID=572546 RepID=D2REF8_ARCPA|nr:sodium:calcium antiporter [Archaeoglobus profundus]ADB58502.1 sodium/calcium exchanger membrane region [Archaeoglobus profundus DSM 5631]